MPNSTGDTVSYGEAVMLVEVDVQVMHRRAESVLVDDGDTEVWLPLSKIEIDDDATDGDHTTISVPEWLAEERGLV